MGASLDSQFLQVYVDRGPSLSGMADYGCISGLTVFTSVSGPGAIVTLAQQRPLEQETLALHLPY